MGIFDFLKTEKKEEVVSTILPQEIYDSGALELKDVIARSALEVTPKQVNRGRKGFEKFLCYILS